MVRGVFVTGTDTGIGKTVVSAAIMLRLRNECAVRYWKPIQTGIEQDDDTAEVARLAACRPYELLTSGVRLPRPLSPHVSARLSGATIDIQPLVDSVNAAASPDTRFVVEGAGGVLVPINDTELMIDLMVRLALPVVVVSRSTLGTINHTLLTLEALRRRSLTIAGIVLVGPRNADNRDAIERYGTAQVLGELPMFAQVEPSGLAEWAAHEFDGTGRMLELLR